jgi:hypothetical protein
MSWGNETGSSSHPTTSHGICFITLFGEQDVLNHVFQLVSGIQRGGDLYTNIVFCFLATHSHFDRRAAAHLFRSTDWLLVTPEETCNVLVVSSRHALADVFFLDSPTTERDRRDGGMYYWGFGVRLVFRSVIRENVSCTSLALAEINLRSLNVYCLTHIPDDEEQSPTGDECHRWLRSEAAGLQQHDCHLLFAHVYKSAYEAFRDMVLQSANVCPIWRQDCEGTPIETIVAAGGSWVGVRGSWALDSAPRDRLIGTPATKIARLAWLYGTSFPVVYVGTHAAGRACREKQRNAAKRQSTDDAGPYNTGNRRMNSSSSSGHAQIQPGSDPTMERFDQKPFHRSEGGSRDLSTLAHLLNRRFFFSDGV